MSSPATELVVDLWGEPVPESAPVREEIGPHPMPIPEHAAEWLRERWLRLPEGQRRIEIGRWQAAERQRERAREREKARRRAGNPLVAIHGPGPAGAHCGSCRHLYEKVYANRYYKCALRPDTNGPATDHRVRWPACGRYEAANDDKQKRQAER